MARPRWAKRPQACKYAGIGRTKLDELIGEGRIEARKEDGGGRNTPVWVDLNSIDAFFANLPRAPGKKPVPEHP
jgi:hypothetical protein